MFELNDFFHLSEVDQLLANITDDPRGITVVSGLGPRSAQRKVSGSGNGPLAQFDRALISSILMRQILDRPQNGSQKKSKAVVLAPGRHALQIAEHQRKQVGVIPAPVDHIDGFTTGLQIAMMRNPDLLVISLLNTVTAQATFHAAAAGRRVLTQIDTTVMGGTVLQEIVGLGCSPSQMSLVSWVVGVKSVPMLCTHCKQPHEPKQKLIDKLAKRHDLPSDTTFYTGLGCEHCNGTGFLHELAAFDIFRVSGGVSSFSELVSSPSLLSFETYMAQLAAQGYVPLEDVVREFTSKPQVDRERAAPDEGSVVLQRKLSAVEVANDLLAQRINKLTLQQDVARALYTSDGVEELTARTVNFARELSAADRVVLYLIDPPDVARIAALSGWDDDLLGQTTHLPKSMLERGNPEQVVGAPPGIDLSEDEVGALQVSMRFPLVAEGTLVALMIINSLEKIRFSQDEIAQLKSIGELAGALIFRELVLDTLSNKIAQLESSQEKLIAATQRAHELDVATRLHNDLLPKSLPEIDGIQFAATYRPMPDLGADLYDVFDLGDGRLGLFIADIADSGLTATRTMSIARATVRSEAQRSDSPRDVLTHLHNVLRDLGASESYMTAFYGIFEPKTRRLIYCRAGHDPPLWLRTDGNNVMLGVAVGTPLGALEPERLDLAELEVFLSRGDVMIFYTDGMTDAVDPNGTEFGVQPWIKLARENIELAPAEMCALLFDEVVAFQSGAAQIDDMALLILRIDA